VTTNKTPAELRAHAAVLLAEAAQLEPPISLDDLDAMTPDAIVAARRAGHLDHLINPTTTSEGA
jgi:hypothetical protein